MTIHPAKGDHVFSRGVSFGGTATGPIALGITPDENCSFGKNPRLASNLDNGSGCGAKH